MLRNLLTIVDLYFRCISWRVLGSESILIITEFLKSY